MPEEITVFKPYDFKIGEKIFIEAGRRKGDWEVVGLNDTKVKLRCPISGEEVEWVRFCYFLEHRQQEWPERD